MFQIRILFMNIIVFDKNFVMFIQLAIKLSFVQMVAWFRYGDRPSSKAMMSYCDVSHGIDETIADCNFNHRTNKYSVS